MFRTIFTIILFSVSLTSIGQMPGSFRYDDSLTYSLYMENRWNDLLTEGLNAVKKGNDYYYMRMRIGIAYYEKHNYAMAAKQFRKALVFNANDQIALEYLFYTYYLSGSQSMAFALVPSLYPENRERILEESDFRKNSLTFESFYSDALTDNILSDPDSYFSDYEPGSQIATKYFLNNEIYASHIIGNNVSYFHSFTNLIKDNYLHYFDGTNKAHLFPQRIVQNQYYGSLNIFSATGWLLSPSFHFLTTGYPQVTFSSGMNPSLITYKVRSNGYFAGLAVTKSLGYVVIGLESGFADLNQAKRLQETISMMVYPLGNTTFYFGGRISGGKDLKINRSGIILAGGYSAGFSIAGKVWFEFSGLTGDLKNYADQNGLYIYNSADILKSRLTGRMILPVNKTGLTIYAGGGISSYSSEFISEGGSVSEIANKLNYNSNNFIGGISWKF
jgi:hypothetical protein